MNEQIKSKIITSCHNISNEKKVLLKTKKDLETAASLCSLDTISINNINMKSSIEALGTDIDKITQEIDNYIEDINNEIAVMNRVV